MKQRTQGSQGPPIVFVTGPPTGAALFRRVQERLEPRHTVAIELIGQSAPTTLPALVAQLEAASEGAALVVAHGLAVPVALSADLPALLVTNGPISQLDRVSRGLARLPERVLADTVLRPEVVQRWLSSSAGLRRTVANPYVMDRDIVVMLTQAMTESAESRRSAAQWLRATADALPIEHSRTRVISALWGDDDVLYPLGEARRALAALGCDAVQTVSGARHHHPEERPWELADAVAVLLEELTTT